MQSTARDQYLYTDVNTATAERLQLLLIEGALRLANRARQHWQQGRKDRAIRALLEAQAILVHMMGVIDRQTGGELAARVSAVYEFIYRSLVKAGYYHDESALDDAVRVLEIERQTWRQVCDKLAAHIAPPVFSQSDRSGPPHLVGEEQLFHESEGFSIEA